jgi:NADH-quinone oxidoreductase subunit M
MVIGVFSSLDSILFYVFWEGMLIPMYLSIGIWGGSNRSYASIKFFIYTFFGSALMIAGLLYLGLHAHSLMITDFYKLPLSMPVQLWLFAGFTLAFMVKVPMWPLHTWLPDAHTESPAGGSVVLAALMLKLGTYGFMRFSLPIVPDACSYLANFMIVLSLISIVYISIIAIQQKDMKRLIAYSSIAHMGFVTLGCFSIYLIMRITHDIQYAYYAFEGAMFQMIAHAFSSGAMFIGVGILYDRMHTHQMNHFGGVASKMPIFTAFFMLFCLSNIGVPGTSGFVGEFMILISLFKTNFWILAVAASAVIFSCAYTLWMFRQVFFGAVNPDIAQIKEINPIETINLIILGVLIIYLGVYPQPVLTMFHATTGHLLQLSLTSKL